MEIPKWVLPVIFLDFDGVLVLPDGAWCPEAMLEVNRLCLETGAAVVLTTSFRYSGSARALHKTMLVNGFDKTVAVLGETRDLGAYRAAEKKGDLMFLCEFEKWSKGGRSRRGWASIRARRGLWSLMTNPTSARPTKRERWCRSGRLARATANGR